MRLEALAVIFLLPVPGFTQDINPFLPGGISRPAASVFVPAPPSRVLVPPPLPKMDAASAPAPDESAIANVPAPKTSTASTCKIEVTPRSPLIGSQGGEFTLRVEEGARNQSCVAGIESRESWLKIRYFNGQELTLYAEPNYGRTARHGELLFANAVDSLVLKIVQASP